MINPPRGEVVQRGDRIIVLAEDDDSTKSVRNHPVCVEHEEDVHTPKTPRPERVLFCGWRRDLDDVINYWTTSSSPARSPPLFGSRGPGAEGRLAKARDQRKRPPTLSKLKVVHATGDLCSRRDLERLPVGAVHVLYNNGG